MPSRELHPVTCYGIGLGDGLPIHREAVKLAIEPGTAGLVGSQYRGDNDE